jgi:glutamine amidotransferase
MKLKIGIIDYGMGNLFSIKNVLDSFNVNAIISSNYEELINTNALILPGVGSFDKAMENLISSNLDILISDFIKTGKPFLGICLGFQLLFSSSSENNQTKGLQIIKGKVLRFNNTVSLTTVPRVEWGETDFLNNHSILNGLSKNDFMYYVHSYYAEPDDISISIAKTNYCGIDYCSGIQFKNVFGFQFHPEKSSKKGIKIIENFLTIAQNNLGVSL